MKNIPNVLLDKTKTSEFIYSKTIRAHIPPSCGDLTLGSKQESWCSCSLKISFDVHWTTLNNIKSMKQNLNAFPIRIWFFPSSVKPGRWIRRWLACARSWVRVPARAHKKAKKSKKSKKNKKCKTTKLFHVALVFVWIILENKLRQNVIAKETKNF